MIETIVLAQSSLATIPVGRWFRVTSVVAPDWAPEWKQRLGEIGFIVGEPVRVLTRGMPGGDPVAVRVGHSTFALRKAEAECVCVTPIDERAEEARTR